MISNPITIKARITFKKKEEGGSKAGIKSGYRPNHAFEKPIDIKQLRAYIIIGLFVFGVSINVLLAQPLAVKKGLKQEFPAAKNIKWNKKHNLWNADFFIGDKKTSALFDLEGHWLSAQQEIRLEEIGVEEVKTAIKKDFSGCKSLSIIIINRASSGTWYEVTGTCGNDVRTRSYDYMGLPLPKIS